MRYLCCDELGITTHFREVLLLGCHRVAHSVAHSVFMAGTGGKVIRQHTMCTIQGLRHLGSAMDCFI